MKVKEHVKESPFANEYGALSLVIGEDGKPYLKMDNSRGADFHGPLTGEQVLAFQLLCQVEEVGES